MSNTGATPTPLKADQETALGHLASVITEHQNNGRPVPCPGHKSKGSPWLSENPTDLSESAEACGHCPTVRACGAYALAYNEPAGAWGGMTPKSREHFRRTTKTQNPRSAA